MNDHIPMARRALVDRYTMREVELVDQAPPPYVPTRNEYKGPPAYGDDEWPAGDPMPMDMKRYPPNWRDISHRIRFERAKGRCERCGAEHGKPHPDTGSVVMLTTAHIGAPHPDGRPGDKHDKMDVRDENLRALCQRCHLREDIDEHVLNAARTRRAKKIAAGQEELPL